MKGERNVNPCDHYKGLLMGLIDNELTPEEAREVSDHLVRCERCRRAYEELGETASKIGKVSFREPTDEELEALWKSPFSRAARNSGLFLVLAGWVALILYGVIQALRDNGEPLFPRLAAVAVILGFVILLLTVIRERLVILKTDPYKEIKR